MREIPQASRWLSRRGTSAPWTAILDELLLPFLTHLVYIAPITIVILIPSNIHQFFQITSNLDLGGQSKHVMGIYAICYILDASFDLLICFWHTLKEENIASGWKHRLEVTRELDKLQVLLFTWSNNGWDSKLCGWRSAWLSHHFPPSASVKVFEKPALDSWGIFQHRFSRTGGARRLLARRWWK